MIKPVANERKKRKENLIPHHLTGRRSATRGDRRGRWVARPIAATIASCERRIILRAALVVGRMIQAQPT